MKNLIYSTLLLACSFNFFGQNTFKHIKKAKVSTSLSAGRAQSAPPTCLLDSLVQNGWDTVTDSWGRISKEVYTYNLHSDLSTSTLYIPMPSTLTPYARTGLSYNSQNTLTLTVQDNWDFPTSSWKSNSRSTYTYSTANDKTKQLDEAWDSGSNSWQNNLRTSYIYNATHSLTSEAAEFWTNNSWQNVYKNTTTYNNSGLSGFTFFMWNTSLSSWDTIQKISFIYTGNKITSASSLTWDSNQNAWENEFAYQYTYTGNNMTYEIVQLWMNNNWVDESSYTYTYDASNNMTEELAKSWDVATNSWVNQFNSKYYYTCDLTGIKEWSGSSKVFSLYPNPAQSELFIGATLDYTSSKIISVSGKEVLFSENKNSIPVSSLEKGIYFVQLLDKNGAVMATGKFVKD